MDPLSIYVYVENQAFDEVNIDQESLCITNSEDEAHQFFINLRPYYIELWEEDHETYESLSPAEKRIINNEILNSHGLMSRVPISSVAGINLVKNM